MLFAGGEIGGLGARMVGMNGSFLLMDTTC